MARDQAGAAGGVHPLYHPAAGADDGAELYRDAGAGRAKLGRDHAAQLSRHLGNIAITIPVALPAAFAFARLSFLGDKHLFFSFIAFRITPPVVLTLPIFQLFSVLGIVNSVTGIALAHCLFNLPVSIWILQGFIAAVPREMDETAFLDGYSRPRYIWKILLPQIAPGIAVTAFFCFMFSWVEVVFARILTTTNGKPISMALSAMFGFQTDIGMVMAFTLTSMLPGALLLFAMRNHLSRGFKVGRV